MPGAVIPTEEEIAWMLSRPQDNRVVNLLAAGLITFTFSTAFVVLRLWSRRVVRGRLNLDVSDWFAIAAWIFYLPFTASYLLSTKYGVGRHVVFATNTRLLGILLILEENFYAATLLCLKFSILSLYRNIFRSSRRFYWCTWVANVLVAEWFLQVVLATNLQCIPIAAAWDPYVDGKCINYGVEALVAYIINISTDIFILSMPIPVVLKLKVSKAQKRRLIISFAAGGSACIVNLAQLAYITKLGNDPDSTWSIVPTSYIGATEVMVGFLAASIATYRPLYRFIFVEPSTRHSEGGVDSGAAPYRGSYQSNPQRRSILVGTSDPSGNRADNLRRGIVVTNHIELTRHNTQQGAWIKVGDDESWN